VLADQDAVLGREVESELQALGECFFVRCDVTCEGDVHDAVASAVSTYCRLDAAFNAAGIEGEQGNATADCTTANWERVIAVDLTGVWYCVRSQIQHMLENGGGSIVNCASVAGIIGAPYVPAYVAAKHGVVGLTKAAALEYASRGIRVNAVCPGMIDTPMSRKAMTPEVRSALLAESPIGRLGDPSEVAAAVFWLCDDGASYLTGQAIAIDGAWTSR
jgi:NAD(P)-dependent dehydrogenase (short-subunit alcohol dehydrogenase family)